MKMEVAAAGKALFSVMFFCVSTTNDFDVRFWQRHFRLIKTTLEMVCNEIGLLISPVIHLHVQVYICLNLHCSHVHCN